MTHIIVVRRSLVAERLRASLVVAGLDVLQSVVTLALGGLLGLRASRLLGIGLHSRS